MAGRTFAMITVLAALVLGAPEAEAAASIQLVEPADGFLELGSVAVFTTSAPKRITVQNVGDAPPHSLFIGLGGPFQVVGQGGSLAPGSSMYWDVVVTPQPDEMWGCSDFFDVFWSTGPGGGQEQTTTVIVSCGVDPGPYQTPNPLQHFGEVAQGASITRTVPLTNTGAVAQQITAISVGSGPFTAQLHGGSLPLTVAPGATFEVDVTFAPPDPFHFMTDVLITDGGGLRWGFRVVGVGTAVQVALSTQSLAFGDTYRHPIVPPTADVVLTNVGAQPATLPAATITGPGFSILSGPPPGVLSPQASVTYRVAFAPSSVGTLQGQLSLGALGQIALSGRGVLRPVSAATSLDFGAVPVGTSAIRSLPLHNAGPSAITVSSLDTDYKRFRILSADRTIPPFGELVLDVEYTPSGSGADQAALSIALDGDPAPQLGVTLQGAACIDVRCD